VLTKLVVELLWITSLLRLEIYRARKSQKRAHAPFAAAPDVQLPTCAGPELSREASLSSRHESLQAQKKSLLNRLTALGLTIGEDQNQRMNNKALIRELTIQEEKDESSRKRPTASSMCRDREITSGGYGGAIIGRSMSEREREREDQREVRSSFSVVL